MEKNVKKQVSYRKQPILYIFGHQRAEIRPMRPKIESFL